MYDIMKMKACMFLNGIYMILLKWGVVCDCVRLIWYY